MARHYSHSELWYSKVLGRWNTQDNTMYPSIFHISGNCIHVKKTTTALEYKVRLLTFSTIKWLCYCRSSNSKERIISLSLQIAPLQKLSLATHLFFFKIAQTTEIVTSNSLGFFSRFFTNSIWQPTPKLRKVAFQICSISKAKQLPSITTSPKKDVLRKFLFFGEKVDRCSEKIPFFGEKVERYSEKVPFFEKR